VSVERSRRRASARVLSPRFESRSLPRFESRLLLRFSRLPRPQPRPDPLPPLSLDELSRLLLRLELELELPRLELPLLRLELLELLELLLLELRLEPLLLRPDPPPLPRLELLLLELLLLLPLPPPCRPCARVNVTSIKPTLRTHAAIKNPIRFFRIVGFIRAPPFESETSGQQFNRGEIAMPRIILSIQSTRDSVVGTRQCVSTTCVSGWVFTPKA
jgi:hypothetical protein